jgi:hypothetical protein
MKIRMAELNIEIQNRYPYLENICKDYMADFKDADIFVTVSEAEIADEIIRSTLPKPPAPGYAEAIAAFRAIAMQLPRFDAFVFHAAVIGYKGKGYAFSAPSGTGKTTHARLWLRAFDGAEVINGDKPILRFMNGKLYAFGTPWCGKEKMQQNKSVPLSALGFIERAAENSVKELDNAETLLRLYSQILMPQNREVAMHFLDLLDRMVKMTPAFVIACNQNLDAALVAYRGMKGV